MQEPIAVAEPLENPVAASSFGIHDVVVAPRRRFFPPARLDALRSNDALNGNAPAPEAKEPQLIQRVPFDGYGLRLRQKPQWARPQAAPRGVQTVPRRVFAE